jgi:RNA polymerase sigma-70 factor (ECF subfamily)
VSASAERKLVKRLKARNPHAFESLMQRYQGPIFNMLFRMIGNREEAEDLAQEVFITVFKRIDTFRGESSLATWIYRIASNHCINRRKYLMRRKHFDKRSLDDVGDREQLGDGWAGVSERLPRPDEMVEGLHMERRIQQAISDLDEDQRLVVVLRDIQNLSYEEIGSITGLAPGTVKSRLHRARMALKEKLAAHLR